MSQPLLSVISRIAQTWSPRERVAFMLRNTPGATVDPDDIRTVQAAVAWWRGFAGEGVEFEAYLEPIPMAPDFEVLRKLFPDLNLPLLVDPRLGQVRSARLLGLKSAQQAVYDGMFNPVDARHALPTDVPYWVLAHDGRSNLNRRPSECLAECSERLLAGTADVLMAILLQYGPRSHGMDGPGSALAGSLTGACACLGPDSCFVARGVTPLPRYGSVFMVLA